MRLCDRRQEENSRAVGKERRESSCNEEEVEVRAREMGGMTIELERRRIRMVY